MSNNRVSPQWVWWSSQQTTLPSSRCPTKTSPRCQELRRLSREAPTPSWTRWSCPPRGWRQSRWTYCAHCEKLVKLNVVGPDAGEILIRIIFWPRFNQNDLWREPTWLSFQEMAKTAQARKGIQTSPDGKGDLLYRVYEARSVERLPCDPKTTFPNFLPISQLIVSGLKN